MPLCLLSLLIVSRVIDMQEIIYFIVYNIAGFLIGLLVWNRLPKPKPNDYTTIPGFKLDRDVDHLPDIAPAPGQNIAEHSTECGNLAAIQASTSFVHFICQLHEVFGDLASFYWGPRYVVSIGGGRMFLRSLSTHAEHALAIPCGAIANVLAGDELCWTRIKWQSLQEEPPIELKQNSLMTNAIKMLSISEQNTQLMDGPFDQQHITRMRPYLKELADQSIDSKDYYRLLCTLSTIAIDRDQTSLIVVAFDREIDLNGHPIPAFIPILINIDLFNDAVMANEISWIPGINNNLIEKFTSRS